MAQEGADIVAIDICENIEVFAYDLASEADLAETTRLVEETGRDTLAVKADVRDLAAMQKAVASGLERFGHIDIVSANAGIAVFGQAWEFEPESGATCSMST